MRLTEELLAVKQILLIMSQLVDACIEKRTMNNIYNLQYTQAMPYGKVDKDPYEDDMEELWYLSFHEIEGERYIEDGPITNVP